MVLNGRCVAASSPIRIAQRGTVLLLTLMMLVLLTFEVAVISLVAQRGLGDEAMLQSQSVAARRSGEVALNRLEEALTAYLKNGTEAGADVDFAYGGIQALTDVDLMVTNPVTTTQESTGIKISAWVESRRGSWYHLVGRARQDNVDLLVHRWVKASPCKLSGTLTTIISGVKNPGAGNSILVSSKGRVFFGQYANAGQNGGGSYWTWHKDTGLSTLVTGMDNPMAIESWEWPRARAAIDGTDRVVFTSRPAWRTWTWHDSTGLSTLVQDPGDSVKVSPGGRFYWGGSWGGNSMTWKLSSGLSTIRSNVGANGMEPGWGPVSDTRAFLVWVEDATTEKTMYRWDAAEGLSTVIEAVDTTGIANALQSNNGANDSLTDVYVAEDWNDPSGTTLRWNKSDGLSTLKSENCYACGPQGTLPDGSVLFGGYSEPFLWSTASGLSTITSLWQTANIQEADYQAQELLIASGTDMYWWKRTPGPSPNRGTSTLINSFGFNVGQGNAAYDHVSKRVFFGSNHTSNSRFYTWKAGTGLSTILGNTSGKNQAGLYSTVLDLKTRDMVYFGDDKASGSMNVWTPSYGLSTIVTGRPNPGVDVTAASPLGGVFFGEAGSSVNFYYWQPPGDCNDRGF